MLKLAALALAATSAATPTPALDSTASWWEKITVTMSGDGKAQSCRYESSLNKTDNCDVVGGTPAAKGSSADAGEQFTKITFERRFSPAGTEMDMSKLHPGDTLLGGQVMALAIDATGAVKGCSVVAASGGMKPDYGCEEATAEKFAASTGANQSRQGFMTILVYGHSEELA